MATAKESPAVLVDIDAEDSPTCFVIMPYDLQFASLYDVIANAANRLQLTPQRLDQTPRLDFVRDVVQRPRSAALIVAVCTPESGSNQPNPNVMYELGLAHALGRPTLILTTDPSRLPADIYSKYAVTYSDAEPAQAPAGLADRIESVMRKILDRTIDGIVDKDWQEHGVHAIRARYRFCFLTDFMQAFTVIVAFAEDVHHHFQQVDNAIDRVKKEIEDVALKAVVPSRAKVDSFCEACELYREAYANTSRQFLSGDLDDRLRAVEAAFISIEDVATIEAATIFQQARAFYELIKTNLDDFSTKHNEVLSGHFDHRHFEKQLQNYVLANDLATKIQSLANTTTRVLNFSHALIRCVVQVFVEGDNSDGH